ncbi:hypothetical protein NCCP2145_38840 [Pseudarthrobacter sp. NCCP-2145]|nr:hypothetical protein NCCP2145_38840 [Pseudarthrobacter sp. NCCP-2145]
MVHEGPLTAGHPRDQATTVSTVGPGITVMLGPKKVDIVRLDTSGKYHMGWAHSSSIRRVKPEEWKGSSAL